MGYSTEFYASFKRNRREICFDISNNSMEDKKFYCDSFKCTICREILNSPIMKPKVCNHRFCRPCLVKHLSTQTKKNCPTCRIEFTNIRHCEEDHIFLELIERLNVRPVQAYFDKLAEKKMKEIEDQLKVLNKEKESEEPTPEKPLENDDFDMKININLRTEDSFNEWEEFEEHLDIPFGDIMIN